MAGRDNWMKLVLPGALGKSRARHDVDDSTLHKNDPQSLILTGYDHMVDISGNLPTIIAEYGDPNSLANQYIYADAQILCQYVGHDDPNVTDQTYYYVHDRLGSVRLVVDCNMIDETVTARNDYTYSPFGNPYPGTVTETIHNPFQFTGQWFDSEINQYYLRARMYDPTMMRFMTRDPVRGKGIEPVTLHRYLYCVNDPLNRTDVNGEFSGLAGQLMTHAIKGALWGAVGGTYGGVLKACRTGNGHDIWKGTLAGGIAGGLAGGTAWLGGSGLVGQILGGMMGGAANHTTSAMLNSDYEHFWAELGGAVVVGGALAGIMDYYSVGESVASSGIDAGNARSFLQGVDWLEPAAAELAGGLVTAAEELYDSARENIYDPWE